jgi:hypothetical protein
MAHRTITQISDFEGTHDFHGTIAVLGGDSSTPTPTAHLVLAQSGSGVSRVELGVRHGIWHLSVPSSDGAVVFRRQTREVETLLPRRSIPFADHEALKALNERFRKNEPFQSAFLDFARAAVLNLSRLEAERGWHFPLLDEVARPDRAGHRDLSPVKWLADKKDQPGEAAWVGIEVFDFTRCMSKCEDDADWWEVWVHAYCLVKCGIKSGTAGGPLFK